MKINFLAFTTDTELLVRLNTLIYDGEEITIHTAETIEGLPDLPEPQRFDAALIDTTNSEIQLEMLTRELQAEHPGIKISLILSADNNPENSLPEGVAYHKLLTRPLRDADLVSMVDELVIHSGSNNDKTATVPAEINPDEIQTEEVHEPSLIEIIDAAVFEPENKETTRSVETSAADAELEFAVGLETSSGAPVEISPNLAGNTSPEVGALRLNYTCVLVPRHPRQYLTRHLAARAASILPQLHLSRGWRMTGISVRPQYLQWNIALPSDICPHQAMQEIRQRTSAYFYTHFPELALPGHEQNFWAPGYLMMSGSQPLSPAIIREFIQRVHTPQQSGD